MLLQFYQCAMPFDYHKAYFLKTSFIYLYSNLNFNDTHPTCLVFKKYFYCTVGRCTFCTCFHRNIITYYCTSNKVYVTISSFGGLISDHIRRPTTVHIYHWCLFEYTAFSRIAGCLIEDTGFYIFLYSNHRAYYKL